MSDLKATYGAKDFPVCGKMSVFGGPGDLGVQPDEGLALMTQADVENKEYYGLFLPQQPQGTTGLARRLNPQAYYIAMRWNYSSLPKGKLKLAFVKLTNGEASILCRPVDWGPNIRTGRIADLSPGAAYALGLRTDDIVTVELQIT